MTKTPELCILIPAWKDQHGLSQTLEILGEEEAPFDIIVVDDGSPTPIECEPAYGKHEVLLHRLPQNRGIEHALNAGLELIYSKGYRYIARLDCGDLPNSGRLEKQVEYLDTHPNVGIVGTWAKCIDDDGNYLFTLRFPADHRAMLRQQRYVPSLLHPTIMIRTEAMRKIGFYSDKYRTAEDYELYVRMSKHYQIANIPETLTQYIVSQSGTTARKRQKNLVSRLRIQIDYFDFLNIHSYFGVVRTLIFMTIPFNWLISVKRVLWQ